MLVELSVVEQRYQAVMEVLTTHLSVAEVARRHNVSRQSVHTWLRRYSELGLAGLVDRSHRPHVSPARIAHELDRLVNAIGRVSVSNHPLVVGVALAGRNLTLRLEDDLCHLVVDGALTRTFPSPVSKAERARLRGARFAAERPPPPSGPPVVTRRPSLPIKKVVTDALVATDGDPGPWTGTGLCRVFHGERRGRARRRRNRPGRCTSG